MSEMISKSNRDLEYFNRRLDTVLMTSHERLRAKAQLARAEAMASFLHAAAAGLRRLFRSALARPASGGTATHAG